MSRAPGCSQQPHTAQHSWPGHTAGAVRVRGTHNDVVVGSESGQPPCRMTPGTYHWAETMLMTVPPVQVSVATSSSTASVVIVLQAGSGVGAVQTSCELAGKDRMQARGRGVGG